MSDRVDALVIFGATGDLAKIETFPALVGLVERDVLNVPVIGVSKKGWDLEQFRDYATASLQLNKMDPGSPAAVKMLSLLRYVDGDLGDDATYRAMSDMIGPGEQVLFYMEVPAFLFGRIAQGIATAGRARGAQFPDRPGPARCLCQVPDQGSRRAIHRLLRRRLHRGRQQDCPQPAARAPRERRLRTDDRHRAPRALQPAADRRRASSAPGTGGIPAPRPHLPAAPHPGPVAPGSPSRPAAADRPR